MFFFSFNLHCCIFGSAIRSSLCWIFTKNFKIKIFYFYRIFKNKIYLAPDYYKIFNVALLTIKLVTFTLSAFPTREIIAISRSCNYVALFIIVDHKQMTSRWVYFTCAKTGWWRRACGHRKFINIHCITGTIISSTESRVVFRHTREWIVRS